jgi:hypothetical protein
VMRPSTRRFFPDDLGSVRDNAFQFDETASVGAGITGTAPAPTALAFRFLPPIGAVFQIFSLEPFDFFEVAPPIAVVADPVLGFAFFPVDDCTLAFPAPLPPAFFSFAPFILECAQVKVDVVRCLSWRS